MTCLPFSTRRAAALLSALLPVWALSCVNAQGADGEAGRRKAELCVACHGPGGVSANPAVPSIAGQPKQSLATQLIMFREGNRKDPLMSAIASSLTNADILEISEHLSSLPLTSSAPAIGDAKAAEAKRLTEQFNCVSCHGPALLGQQHVPRLAGQHRQYLITQLRGFKAGTRFDMDGNMSAAVQNLSEADAELLAEYISGLK